MELPIKDSCPPLGAHRSDPVPGFGSLPLGTPRPCLTPALLSLIIHLSSSVGLPSSLLKISVFLIVANNAL